MTLRDKVILNTIFTFLVVMAIPLLAVIAIVSNTFTHWSAYVFGPIAGIWVAAYLCRRPAGFKCNNCGNSYGVGAGPFPSIPNSCQSCGFDGNVL